MIMIKVLDAEILKVKWVRSLQTIVDFENAETPREYSII